MLRTTVLLWRSSRCSQFKSAWEDDNTRGVTPGSKWSGDRAGRSPDTLLDTSRNGRISAMHLLGERETSSGWLTMAPIYWSQSCNDD